MKNKDAVLMINLFFAYCDPKPMKLKDSKFILDLFMADITNKEKF